MLDLDKNREGVTPKDAATIVLVRDREAPASAEGGSSSRSDKGAGIEVFCVERNKASRFMGGAIVFPGGKLDASDVVDEWTPLATPPRVPGRSIVPFTANEAHFRSLAIAAARETLEEAAMLHVSDGSVTQEELVTLRKELSEAPDSLRTFLAKRRLRLDLGALHPFARWITPTAEARRFDARFFVAIAPRGQVGAHDERETMSSFWASPEEAIRRFDAGEVQLMPPTHRTFLVLADCTSTKDVLRLAESSCLDPIQPTLVKHTDASGETLALVLPGDPEHEVREMRVAGPSRYVLRGERWRAESPP